MEAKEGKKIYKLKTVIKTQKTEIEQLKKEQKRKMIKIKFIGIPFDPVKIEFIETKINSALADGFEVVRDHPTAQGIVMELGKYLKNGEASRWDQAVDRELIAHDRDEHND